MAPLSVDEILAKQKAEREAAAKPKFLSKAERQKIALEKRNAEANEQRLREEEERKQRIDFDRAIEEERRRAEQERYGQYERYNGRGHHPHQVHQNHQPRVPSGLRAPPTGPKGMQPPSAPAAANASNDAPTDAEIATIRARYLGAKDEGKKPRLRKEQNKKIVFDWKAEDDTSGTDLRNLVDAQSAPKALLGGSLAGYDLGRGANGTPDNHVDALERRRAGRGNNDDRHWSEKPLDEMKDRDWRIFREDFAIQARGGQIPLPLRTWKESTIPPSILGVIDEVGYTEPSPIQRQAIPIGMQNRDLIGIAKTGSGKTAAFVIPMLDYIGHLPPLTDENRQQGPYALILAPTRELAQQIEGETAKFALPMGYTSVSIIGGRSVEEQQFALRNGAHIIIATPGRLKDMIDKTMIVMSQCRYVVMDEADRMVDMGFELDLNFILDSMPATHLKPEEDALASEWKGYRVTTLFSATMPPAVERLARKYLRKPATVTIGIAGEAVDTVEQRVEFVTGEEKRKARLQEILRTCGLPPPMIVFVNQKKTADMVLRYVHQAGFSATTLHSDKSQAQREEALQALRDGHVAVLVATDIAGRGIDVPDVSLVVNYQMSDVIEKYIHRIGRTGRAGKEGLAITFLNNDDDEVMFDLRVEIEKSKKSKMNPELMRHEAAKQKVTREMKVCSLVCGELYNRIFASFRRAS